MNRAYKLQWNNALNTWVVVSERARGRKKSSSKALGVTAVLLGVMAAGIPGLHAYAAPAVNALPAGEQVASGSASFNRLIASRLVINQHTDKLVTNWNSFDIGANATVIFKQPATSSIALNRISSGTASQIYGKLDANGQVFIVNPAGIAFGLGSQVNTGSLLASTLNISDADFLTGDLRFVRDRANGKVNNEGSLNASTGNVVLLSPTILNPGSVTANAGNIFIVSADSVRVQDNNAIVLQAPLSASVVRQSGSLSATSLASGKGKILLIADKNHAKSEMKVQGSINAQNSWVKGKDIVLTGALTVEGNAALEAAGNIVLNSSFTLLPDNVNGQQRLLSLTYAAGGLQRKNYSTINLRDGSSQLLRMNGDLYKVITTASQLQAIGLNSSTLKDRYVLGINIDASETASWNGGAGFSPIGNNTPPFSGVFDGMGHSIHNLIINRPNENRMALFGYVNGATISNLYLGGFNIKGHTDVAALAAFSRNSNFSKIGLDVRVSGVDRVATLAGFSIDSNVRDSYFMGWAEGTGLRLGGLIGYNRGGVIDKVTGTGQVSGYSADSVGGLMGYSENALIQNSGFYGSVYRNGAMSAYLQAGVGGLVGYMASGEIRNSSANPSLSASYGGGGLVGVNNGTIADSYSDGSLGYGAGVAGENNGLIQRSYSTGYVQGAGLVTTNNGVIEDSYYKGTQVAGQASVRGYSAVAGLVLYNNGLIKRSYVEANVKGLGVKGEDILLGGLVAVNNASGVITDSWMKGDIVSTSRYVGGLVGRNAGTLTNSTAEGSVQGLSEVGGAVGINQAGAVIDNVQVISSVKGKQNIGGLAGSSEAGASITNSTASGTVTGANFTVYRNGTSSFGGISGSKAVGGLAGYNAGQIKRVSSDAVVSGGQDVGGLTGSNWGLLEHSDSTATVSGNSSVGGLAGFNLGLINQSYASSAVSGVGHLGGLVGYNALQSGDTASLHGIINDSYATGTVSGQTVLGGLVGNNDGEINRSYSTTRVTAVNNTYIGGLAGFDNITGTVSRSYWDLERSTVGRSSGGKGLSREQMKTQSSFQGWDISSDPAGSSIWYISNGAPVLRALMTP